MAFVKVADPELRKYIKERKIAEIYEALLSGLAIMCPEDHYKFIIHNLQHLKEIGLDSIKWDMFIDESMKPPLRLASQWNLDEIFDDYAGGITPEMYERAYDHYNQRLHRNAYRAFVIYHLYKKNLSDTLTRNTDLATRHHLHRNYSTVFYSWKHWIDFRKGRQAVAFGKLQHVYNMSLAHLIFDAWQRVTQTAKKTREYFERLERGENAEDDDGIRQGIGEARDDISMLPNVIAVKIFSYIDIRDLARCSRVSRSWKMLTESTSLLSRLSLTSIAESLSDKVAARLLAKYRPYLVHVNMRACDNVDSETFGALRECRNLQDLNLSQVPGLNDETLKIVTDGCSILLYLNVSNTQITDASMRTMASNLDNLQYLSLMNCRRFSDKGLAYFVAGKGAKRLVYLDLSGCEQITEGGYATVSRAARLWNISFSMTCPV